MQSRGPPRPDRLGQLLDAGAHRSGVAGAEDRLREQQTNSATARPGEADGEDEELGGGVGVGAAAPSACPAAGRGGGELGKVRRVADDDVVRRVAPIPREGVADLDADLATSGEQRARRVDGGGVDVDAVEHRRTAGSDDVVGGGGQEATIAARRVEDADALTGVDRRHHGVDDAVDEIHRRRKITTPPSPLPGVVTRR